MDDPSESFFSDVVVNAGAVNNSIAAHVAPSSGYDGWFASLFILAAMLLNAWAFIPSLQDEALYHSDFGFHLSILRTLDETVRSGGNPLDFWYDSSPFGFALFRSYQNLPYLVIYALYTLSLHTLSLDTWLRVTTLFLAVVFPLSIYWSSRKIGFAKFEAGAAALFATLVSENQNFGLGFQNYTFGTGGMVTQLWAVVALAPAMAYAVRYLRYGSGLPIALVWSFLCFGSHVVSAMILAIAVGTFALVNFSFDTYKITLTRALRYFLLLGALTSYQWLFVLLDGRYINKSIVEPPYKYASHGIKWVITQLIGSRLLDFNRLPSLTFLMVIGIVCGLADLILLKRYNKHFLSKVLTWLIVSFVLSLTFLAGWEIWGPLFKNTPVLRSLHMHRFIIAVNLFGVLLAAYGCGVVRALLPQRVAVLVLFTLGLYVLLHPAWVERVHRHQQAEGWRSTASTAFASDTALQSVIAKIKEFPRTYVHPGNHQTWADKLRLARMVPLHDIFIAQGIPTMGGMLFHAFSLAGDTMFNFSAQRSASYDLFGIGLLVAPEEEPVPNFLTLVLHAGKYKLYRYPATRLASITPTFNVSGSRDDEPGFMQRWVSSPMVEAHGYGVIDGRDPALTNIQFKEAVPTNLLPPAQQASTIEEGPWTHAGISAKVVTPTDTHLMFKTGYHPNWRAKVDGVSVPTKWVTPGFIAIPLPKGEHGVSFEYRGSYLKVLLFLCSLLSLTALTSPQLQNVLKTLISRHAVSSGTRVHHPDT